MAFETPKGQTIASFALTSPSRLREVPIDGSPELPGIPLSFGTPVGATKDWIYLALGDANRGSGNIVRLRSLSDKPEIVRSYNKRMDDPVAISPDGKEMIFSSGSSPNADLALVRNFR